MDKEEEREEAILWVVRMHKNWNRFKIGLYTAFGAAVGGTILSAFDII